MTKQKKKYLYSGKDTPKIGHAFEVTEIADLGYSMVVHIPDDVAKVLKAHSIIVKRNDLKEVES